MSAQGVLFAFFAAVAGAAMAGAGGGFFGLVLGYGIGALIQLSGRVKRLEDQIEAQRNTHVGEAASPKAHASAPPAQETPEPFPVPARQVPSVDELDLEMELPVSELLPIVTSHRGASPVREPVIQPEDNLVDKVFGFVKSFFTDGNVVVKVGLLVLFMGVGFLLKYAAAHSMLPPEFRVIGIGLTGVALLVVGWRLRSSRRIYGLLLQGGGVGVMYLTVFGAAKVYHLLPAEAAFVFMVVLVALSGFLAVMQNAKYLALYGAAGGFLAPVLASTGTGSHVMLFSFYALLNTGIVGIAWFRSWRELNLLGFVGTFVIGALWGATYYKPQFFATVEPFLVLFFVFFVIIAVLFACRQPIHLRGYVDSTLVFGVPIISFALQAALVKQMRYGLALSALGASAFYVGLASALWKRGPQGMRLLTEAFLALGVVFGSLAIPLGMDGRWTSAAWALEGAAIVWVGVRQQRILARAFGVLLQVGSGLFFILDLRGSVGSMPIFNGGYLGAVIISIAGLFSSFYLFKHADSLKNWEHHFHFPLFVWGVCWWFGAGLHEIDQFITNDLLVINLFMAFIAASLMVALYLEVKLRWPMLRYLVFGQLFAMMAILATEMVLGMSHPMAHLGWLIWPLAIGALYFFLYRYRDHMKPVMQQWQHVMGFWFVVVFLTWEGAWLSDEFIGGAAWRHAVYGLVPTLMMIALFRKGRLLRWPVAEHYDWYADNAALPVMLALGVFGMGIALFHEGNPMPIIYIPFANPVDIIVGLIGYALVLWRHLLRKSDFPSNRFVRSRLFAYALAIMAFCWLNGIIARSVHHWFGVSHHVVALGRSVIFQASISVAWTLLSLSVMSFASRLRKRQMWFVGLGLFIVVVVKLFLVDISRNSELVMISSLILVAVLAIVFGYYLSPLPPRREEENA